MTEKNILIENAISFIWKICDKKIKSISFDAYNNTAKVIPDKYSNNYEISLNTKKLTLIVSLLLNILI